MGTRGSSHLTGTMVVGGGLVILSFARELLSLAADLVELANAFGARSTAFDVFDSLPIRLAMLAVGLLLIAMSARRTSAASARENSEHTFRASIGSTLSKIMKQGLDAAESVPQKTLSTPVSTLLWRLARNEYRRRGDSAAAGFSTYREVPPTVFKAEAGEFYRLVLELAEVMRLVLAGKTSASEPLRDWYRRLELLDQEMRRELGEEVVTKARSLVSRDVRL